MSIIDKINARLAQLGKTGAEMSRDIGLSNSIYSQWNTGKSKPSNKTLVRVANYLGVSVDYLYGGEDLKKDEKPQKNIPTPEGEDDPLRVEISEALSDMSNEQLVEVLRYMKYVANRED